MHISQNAYFTSCLLTEQNSSAVSLKLLCFSYLQVFWAVHSYLPWVQTIFFVKDLRQLWGLFIFLYVLIAGKLPVVYHNYAMCSSPSPFFILPTFHPIISIFSYSKGALILVEDKQKKNNPTTKDTGIAKEKGWTKSLRYSNSCWPKPYKLCSRSLTWKTYLSLYLEVPSILINPFFPSACSHHPFALFAGMRLEGLVCWALTSCQKLCCWVPGDNQHWMSKQRSCFGTVKHGGVLLLPNLMIFIWLCRYSTGIEYFSITKLGTMLQYFPEYTQHIASIFKI